jgi:hypothetical protein
MTAKHVFPDKAATISRLTLSSEAFSLAVGKKSKWAGFVANLRTDGKWDVCVLNSTMSLLKQIADPGENLSDTIVRILSTSGKAATTGGQDGN